MKKNIARLVAVLAAAVISICAVDAQSKYNKYGNSYNFQRGVEALQNEDYATTVEALSKEIDIHPENAYAHLYLAYVYDLYSDYGKAMATVNKALKSMPKKDKYYTSYCYKIRASVNNSLGMYSDAAADYTQAVKLSPKERTFLYDRAQFFYEQELYDYSDADYAAMIKLDKDDVTAIVGVARNLIAREKYTEAVEALDYVVALYSDYSSGYAFRAQAYAGLEDYVSAASDIVSALSIDGSDNAFMTMMGIAEPGYEQLVARLRAKSITESNNYYWPYCIGIVNELNEKYEQAAEYYTKSATIDPTDVTYARLASVLEDLGRYEESAAAIEKAIDMDPKDETYHNIRSNLYRYAGDLDSAISEQNICVELDPESYLPYHRRGWFRFLKGDYRDAVEDFNMSIAMRQDNAFGYYRRGRAYEKMGERAKAEADYRRAIELDKDPGSNSCAEFAYFHLGENTKALEFLGKLIDAEKEEAYYDAACLYSLMGNVQTSLDYLKKAIESGAFKNYMHMILDEDLENIRETPEFQSLAEKYAGINTEVSLENDPSVTVSTKVTEIPFTRANGVLKVKCTINELPLQFIFDTGASSVSISSLEATFMYKNDYLSAKDIVGKSAFIDANGDISIGTVINLKKVSFAGIDLENVKASVVSNDKAPLLLGQTVLSRLGKVEIDYDKNVIRITSKEISKK